VTDDGGITLRYAERFAAGQGLTYNDYEKVNGASAPVWTMLLGGTLRLGLSPSETVIGLGKCLFAATGLGLFLALSRQSILAGLVMLVGFLGIPAFYASHFTGLETPLTFFLAVGCVAASSLRTPPFGGCHHDTPS
jgi:hypothetical protein